MNEYEEEIERQRRYLKREKENLKRQEEVLNYLENCKTVETKGMFMNDFLTKFKVTVGDITLDQITGDGRSNIGSERLTRETATFYAGMYYFTKEQKEIIKTYCKVIYGVGNVEITYGDDENNIKDSLG
tara:strand:+ start:31 stop:417 length:387 start_codon:yes stop_codon:yes gene_type:complete